MGICKQQVPIGTWCKVKSWGLYRNRLQKPENGAGEAMQPPKIGFSKKKSTILPTKYSAFLVENTGPILITVTLLQSMHGALLGELSPHSFGNNKKTPHVSV